MAYRVGRQELQEINKELKFAATAKCQTQFHQLYDRSEHSVGCAPLGTRRPIFVPLPLEPEIVMSSRKFGLNLVVVLAIAALFTGFWALINRPVSAPNWPDQISGFSYSPFQQGQYPQKDQYPTDDEMRRDLEIISKLTDNIRTYSVDGTLGDIPKLAEEFGLRVTLGIWISPDLERNEREIQKAIELANNSRSVVRVVVGNEALFREEITPEDLAVLLDRVRAAVKVPVTTSEQWHIWEKYPQLAAPRKTARLRRRENLAALTRRPHFLSASSLFAACCLSASSSSPCCDASL